MFTTIFIETLTNYARTILPWIFLGIILAYFAEHHLTPKTVRKYLGSSGRSQIIAAIVLGMISPLSILSFLPLASEFITLGASPGILFGFLVAERAYDLQSFFILTGLFGLRFAILNALAIFISIYIAIVALRNQKIRFRAKKKKQQLSFWQRQFRLVVIVISGIFVSALLRSVIPQDAFQSVTGSSFGGISVALLLGLGLYLGPIIANYPIGKAFLDLGMSVPGVFAFLTVSPVINVVIIAIFGAAVGYRTTFKSFLIYGFISLLFTIIFIPFLGTF